MSATRVLIVDDQKIFRVLLHDILAGVPEIDLVGEAATGQEAIDLAKALEPEVVLMDIELGSEPNGIQASHVIKAHRPTTGIVLFSTHKSAEYIVNATGWSYLLKNNINDVDSLVRAINGAAWGIIAVDPDVMQELQPTPDTPLWHLSPEPARVLSLMAQGYDNSIIANKMNINVRAVEEWQQLIYQELEIETGEGVDPRFKAVTAYLEQMGQVTQDEAESESVVEPVIYESPSHAAESPSHSAETPSRAANMNPVRSPRQRLASAIEKMDSEHFRILELVAQGFSNMAIAEMLHLDERSVQEYLDVTYHELGIGSDPRIDPRVTLARTCLDSSLESRG